MLKKIIILILILGPIAVGIFLYFYYMSSKTTDVPTDLVDIENFFPDGTNQTNTQNTSGEGQNDQNTNQDGYDQLSKPVALLKQIYKDPISGAGINQVNKKDFIRFIDKATGHIHESPLDTFVVSKISNTTIPKVEEGIWTENGTGVVLRYVKSDNKTIESFYTKLATASTVSAEDSISPQTLEGTFLPQNIVSIAVSPQKNTIAYIAKQNTSGSALLESNPDGKKVKELSKLPLQELVISWPKQDTLALSTKPSYSTQGVLFLFNKNTGRIKNILSEIGLTTLINPSASGVVYSKNLNGITTTHLYTINTKSSEILPIQTLPEKCLWSSVNTNIIYCAVPTEILSGNLPDTWYQGIVSFSDEIWEMDLETGTTRLLVNPQIFSGEEIDAINLFTNEKEDHLFFTNKKDDSLWALRLKNTSE